jgi:hypothetical protein
MSLAVARCVIDEAIPNSTNQYFAVPVRIATLQIDRTLKLVVHVANHDAADVIKTTYVQQ